MTRMFYNEVRGVLVCFDLTDSDSFDNLQYWLNDLEQFAAKDVVKMLCGLKIDLIQPKENGSTSSVAMKR